MVATPQHDYHFLEQKMLKVQEMKKLIHKFDLSRLVENLCN
jgi:hypothetical protein